MKGSLDERLAEELPDFGAGEWRDGGGGVGSAGDRRNGDGIGDGDRDFAGGEGEPVDPEAGVVRAGRLVAPDEGAHPDTESDLVAYDVGIDAGAASAEEAAMHVVPADEEDEEDLKGIMNTAKLCTKPAGLVAGAIGGMAAGAIFKRVWRLVDQEREAPKATDEERGWGEVLAASAMHGLLYAVVRAALDRGGAAMVRRMTALGLRE